MEAKLDSSNAGNDSEDEIQPDLSQEWVNQSLDLIPTGIIFTDSFKQIRSINIAGSKITGWSSSDAIGCDLSEVLAVDSEASQPAGAKPGDVMIETRDGRQALIHGRVEAVVYSDTVQGYVAVFEDVSRLRFLELEFEQKQIADSLSLLVGGVTHDLNNDLQAIYSSVVAAKTPSDGNIQRMLTVAEKACLHAQELAGHLLSHSLPSESTLKSESIEEILKGSAMLALAGTTFKPKFSVEENLPPVWVNRTQIEQVFANLLINAAQATPMEGEIRISIAKAAMPKCEEKVAVQACVRDSGPGIDESTLAQVFEPYFTTKMKGRGLGLATCKTIVERHGGEITASSQIGSGTEFCVYLPLAQDFAGEDRFQIHPDEGGHPNS